MGFAYADPQALTEEQRVALAEHQHTVRHQPRELTLKELREEAKLTRAELAARLKLPVERIQRLETGDLGRVQLATLRRYVQALDARIEITAIRGDSQASLA
ncbi:helix-turn-helix domain-containing protein [Glutamicibacter sp. JL.03c]|uniref:helix-turn-helix domain-containing protein n=1 Tax=Glutamicibacter sp. JL.03c TaxID=2984842 RepID=UPI0021F7DA1A|nr:helix-turn-helix transcriptional regulator [Glutamicibacter sp. JL.03c]UYQ77575.1 helix-turn-helix domain-containing protein [Glutamicibacter sp. JL.03c]